jgi:hypothetical protein
MLVRAEQWLRRTLHLKPPYYRMRVRLENAVTQGRLRSEWDFEKHWDDVERPLGGRGCHWLDHNDIDSHAMRVGIEYDKVRTVAELIGLLTKIGQRYS